jgi:hypothetical protein
MFVSGEKMIWCRTHLHSSSDVHHCTSQVTSCIAINEISTSADENFFFCGILNTGKSFALSEPELAEWVRLGISHKNPSKRMKNGLPSISNVSIDISYVILPKYHFSEPFW